jgi:hypothetical protein
MFNLQGLNLLFHSEKIIILYLVLWVRVQLLFLWMDVTQKLYGSDLDINFDVDTFHLGPREDIEKYLFILSIIDTYGQTSSQK